MNTPQQAVHTQESGGIGRNSDSYVVRMPAGMRDLIKARAKNTRRSMNAEIVALIEAGLAAGGVSVEPIVWRQSQAPAPASPELLMAELIIVTMHNALTIEQKAMVQAQLDEAGISGSDAVRSQERRAAIIAGGAA